MSSNLEKLDYAMYMAAKGAATHQEQLERINADPECIRLFKVAEKDLLALGKSVRMTKITRRCMKEARDAPSELAQKILPGFGNNSTIRYQIDESGQNLVHVFYGDNPKPWQIRLHVRHCFRIAEQGRRAANQLSGEADQIIAMMKLRNCTFLEAMDYIAEEAADE